MNRRARARARARAVRIARLLLALLAAAPAAAPLRAAEHGDWPCVQRLVPALEAGQVWSGPPLPEIGAEPPAAAAADAARALIDTGLGQEDLAAKVAAFAAGVPGDRRGEALTGLFAAALAQLNAERGAMIDGIRRYARRQQQLAGKISGETRELEALRRDPQADPARLAELEAGRDWDLRVHTDRQRALRLVCDQPVRLEQRAFALARTIQEQLP